MAVTKPNSNLILVTGGTSATPITMSDIYNADVAGGWGNVVKSGENSYFLNTNLQIGDGTTPTYLTSINENISIGTSTNKRTYKLAANATFQMGALDADGFGITGSSLSVYADWPGQKANFTYFNTEGYNAQRGVTKFYSSIIYFAYAGFSNLDFAAEVDFRDSNFRAFGTIYFPPSSNGRIDRCNMDISTLFYIYSLNVLMDRVAFMGSTTQLLCGGSANLRNIDFGTKSLNRYYSANVFLYDCTIEDSKVFNTANNSGSDKFVYKYYTHQAIAKDAVNAPVDNLQLRISDNLTGGQRYNLATDVNGEIAGQEIVAKTFTCPTSGPITIEDKTDHTLRVRKFGKKFQSLAISLGTRVTTTLLVESDALLTEQVQTTVDAYTELENTDKVYDYSRYWLSQSGNMQFEDVFSKNGNAIDFGSIDAVVDATATNVLDFDGSTVTIKASTYTGNLKTTGVVSVVNGANIVGGIVDANGDSYLSFSGIDNWKLYSTEADSLSGLNEVANGSVSEIYRFNYVANTTYYLALYTSGGTRYTQSSTPIESGETGVNLETTSLLLGLPDAIWSYDVSSVITEGQAGKELQDAQAVADLSILETKAQADARQVALIAEHDATQTAIGSIPTPLTASEVNAEVDTALADYDAPTKSELDAVQSSIESEINANETKIDSVITNIAALNNISAADVRAAFTASDFQDKNTEAEIHAWLNSYASKDDWKADVSSIDLSTLETKVQADARQTALISEHDDTQAALAGLNDIDIADVETAIGNQEPVDANIVSVTGTNVTNVDDFKAVGGTSPADIYTYFTDLARADAFKADIASLATIASINALNNISSADVTAATPTVAQIAAAVEAALINEGDGQQLIDAIVSLINTNLDLPALELAAIANQVRAELAPELARIDENISATKDANIVSVTSTAVTNVDDFKATNVTIPSIPTTEQIADAVWSEQVNQHTDSNTMGGQQPQVDLTPISKSSEVEAARQSIEVEVNANEVKIDSLASSVSTLSNAPTAAQIYAEFIDGANNNAFKADVSGLASQTSLDALSTLVSNLENLSAAQAKAQADQALADYDGPTKAELDAVEAALITAISSGSGSATPSQIWDYLRSETTVLGSMKELIETIGLRVENSNTGSSALENLVGYIEDKNEIVGEIYE